MRYFLLALVSLLVTSTFVDAKSILPSNKSQFIHLLSAKVGSYMLLSGAADRCTAGQLTWLDKKDPNLGFKLGDAIVFNGLHNGTQTNKVANFCIVTTKFKFTTQSITMSKRHTRCDNESDNLDTSKTLRFLSANTLEYRVENTDIQCQFQLQP